jgi:hypothetical protein
MPTDITLTIRCPYLHGGHRVQADDRPQARTVVCPDCAHTVRPGVPEYKCTCRPCLRP